MNPSFAGQPVLGALTPSQLLVCVLLAVIGVVLLIRYARLPAFIALLIASVAVGACGGLGFGQIINEFQEGMGSLLGKIAMIIGLGTVLGKLLAESGGAQQIAQRLLSITGPRQVSWTMLLLGFVVGLPVFFGVGLVILAPILYAVHQKSGLPFLRLAMPMVAGLSAAHGFVPPHPGPMVAVGMLKADMGKTLLYSLVIGAAAAVVGGPLLCRACKFWDQVVPASTLFRPVETPCATRVLPPFWPALVAIVLPILLMALATVVDLMFATGHPVRTIADALGTPLTAMLISVLVAFRVFGTACNFDRAAILKFCEESLAPIASILLVVGAGGGFNKVLIASGVGTAIADFARQTMVSPLLFAWLVAAMIRVATGSATVAISTAAVIVAPLAASAANVRPELLVIAMGAGSLILSHVNDSGFWLVKEYLGLTLAETLKSWTIVETVLSITSLMMVLGVNWLLG